MGISDEITEKLMAGESEDELIQKGYKKRTIQQEANKIEQVLKLHYTLDNKPDIDIKKTLAYVQHSALELSWGTMLAILGLAATFRALWLADKTQVSYNDIAIFLIYAGPLYFIVSNIILIRRLRAIEPPKEKITWQWSILQLCSPLGMILILNGAASYFNWQFLQVLIRYPVGARTLPLITVFVGVLLSAIYILPYVMESMRQNIRKRLITLLYLARIAVSW